MAASIITGGEPLVDVWISDAGSLFDPSDASSWSAKLYGTDPTTFEDDLSQDYSSLVSLHDTIGNYARFKFTTDQSPGTTPASFTAPRAVTLPLTITAASNDRFNTVWNQRFMTFYWDWSRTSQVRRQTMDPGTYTTLGDLITMLNAMEDQDGYEFNESWVFADAGAGKLKITNDGDEDGYFAEHNGSYMQEVDGLAQLGFDDGDALAGGIGGFVNWPGGLYHLYVQFTYGSQVPILGPIDIYVIDNYDHTQTGIATV